MLRKGAYHWENQEIHRESHHLFKTGHSRPCIVPLRVSPCVPVAFVVGQLVLHWGHTHVIICNYRGVGQRMHLKSILKLFALRDGAVTWNMSAMPKEKLNKILSNYWVTYKIKCI